MHLFLALACTACEVSHEILAEIFLVGRGHVVEELSYNDYFQ